MRKIRPPASDPLQVYHNLKEEYGGESFLIESMDPIRKTSRYTILGFNPVFTFTAKDNEVGINESHAKVERPYDYLQTFYHRLKKQTQNKANFANQLVGYLSYDLVKQFETVPTLTNDDLLFPDAHLIVPSVVLYFDHIKREVYSSVPEAEIQHLLKREEPLEHITVGKSRSNIGKREYERAVEQAIEHIYDGDIFQIVLSRRKQASFKGEHLRI
ncbi:MAG: hypothetical protein K9W43_11685 [Candidatus Thorarchaeota archaeon]|nr:hypothetical protein [Candidatus Thorarchaeota archaeon]